MPGSASIQGTEAKSAVTNRESSEPEAYIAQLFSGWLGYVVMTLSLYCCMCEMEIIVPRGMLSLLVIVTTSFLALAEGCRRC